MASKTWSLYVLLGIFLAVGLFVLNRELSAERPRFHEGVEASVAHSPSEFKDVLDFDPLEGLDTGGESREFHVPPPPLSEDYYPCSNCHDEETSNPEKRVLTDEHTNIVLDHDEEHRWCLDCHDFKDRDKLRLASGALVPFEESYRLCGQCHGNVFRDWKAGIHGKRTGYWDGSKRYLLCVHCHWPHAPAFKPLKPLPPPVRPEFIRGTAHLPEGGHGER